MTDSFEPPALPAGSHRRFNPLTGEWVLVSPYRLDRPWQGEVADSATTLEASYDPECYLCPGNVRAAGPVNPDYEGVFVFDNDYPALQPLGTEPVPAEFEADPDELFAAVPEAGNCRVLCFSPDHSRTLSSLSQAEIEAVVGVWTAEAAELGERYPDGSVQIFENKGALMGCSNPHPHSQIWAQRSIPNELRRELERCERYAQRRGAPLLIDYVNRELAFEDRLICRRGHFVALVPYWATWPFEALIVPTQQAARLPSLTKEQRADFAAVLGALSRRYDNLFGVSFPYSAGIHQAPANGHHDASFTLHMHFYPPLLRSATVRKFMVGYEMLAEPQRDLTPEQAAKVLRELPEGLPGD